MALSVSGFPEPSRHTEVYVGDDGYAKSTLMSSPRLRGLFGANSNGANKKPPPTTTSRPDETEFPSTTTTPPPTPCLSFPTSSFEPLSQQEYELEFQLSSKRPRLPSLPRRTSPSPVRLGPNLTRFDIGAWSRSPTTLLHSSSTSHPKPPPQLPSVVVEEWNGVAKMGDTTAATAQPPRPLPSVPGLNKEPPSSNTVAEPTTAPAKPPPPKHVNAVAGPSKHVVANAVAGPSKHPHPLVLFPPTSKVLLTQTPSHKPKTPPSFSMRYQPLVAGTSAELASKDTTSNCSSVRPLPRIPPPAPPPLDTTSRAIPPPSKSKRPKTSPSAIVTGFVPSVPTTNTSTQPSPFVVADKSTTNNVASPWPSKPIVDPQQQVHRRCPSSPPLPISSALKPPPPRSRSVSRPQPLVPTQQQQQPRQRRDRSLDSYYAKNRPAVVAPSIPLVATGARAPRSLPSPSILGARPPKRAATVDVDSLGGANVSSGSGSGSTNKGLKIQTTPALTRSNTHTHTRVTSPAGKRTLPASHPTGPIKPRTTKLSTPVMSPTTTPVAMTPRSLPQLYISVSAPPTRPTSPEKKPSPPAAEAAPAPAVEAVAPAAAAVETTAKHKAPEETYSLESPLHSHPVDAFADADSLLHPTPSLTNPTPTPESPLEVFIDDQHRSAFSRSPSPIRYARPDSHADFDDLDLDLNFECELEELEFGRGSAGEDEDGTSGSEGSVSSGAGGAGAGGSGVGGTIRRKRRREQLRSYRNSYRPRGVADGSPPRIPYRSISPSPAPPIPSQKEKEKDKDGVKEKDKLKPQKSKKSNKSEPRRKGASSYFGGDGSGAGSGSTPGTRASSPERERKSRSRQPRKLAEAVSAALEEVVRGRGGGGTGRTGSPSPRRKGKLAAPLEPPPPLPFPVPSSATFVANANANGNTRDAKMEVLDIRDMPDYMEVLDIRLPPPPPPPPELSSSSSLSSLKRRDTTRTTSTSTGSSSTSDIYVSTSSLPPSSASASARSSSIRVGGSGAIETPFMWVSASKPAVMPVSVSMPFAFGRGKAEGLSSSLKKGKDMEKEKEKDKESKKDKERDSKDKGKRQRTTSAGVSDDPYTVHMEHSNMNPNSNSNLHTETEFDTTATGGVFGWLNNHADPNISDENVASALYEPVYEPSEGGGMVRTTTTRIIRGVDDDGADLWERERETGVRDVIPHLRNLKLRG